MKKMIFTLASLAEFAVFGVTPNTEFQDVPGTDKLGEVLSAGGAVMTEQDPEWNAQKGGYQPKLVSGTNIKTVNGNSLLGNGNVEVKSGDGLTTNSVIDIINKTVDGSARPLPKYLHALDFDDSYPDAAEEYYRSRGNGKTDGGCSSVRDGGLLCRNFDYPFDERAEFVVRVSASSERFASVGVAQVGTNLTEQMVTSGKPEYSRLYKWLPGATVDGVNENGVVCNINVVGGDPQTSGWHTNATSETIHPLGAIRWILDHATNARSAAEYIAANIRFPQGWSQNFHYMVADATSTYIVENGSAYASTIGVSVLTNFRRYPTPFPGEGFERYTILRDGANITNAWYTRAYRPDTTPPWTSEFGGDLDALALATNLWARAPKEDHRGERFGDKVWWQTLHTSVYDITNRVLRISVQETDDWYTFAVPSAGGVKPEAVREIVRPMIGDATNDISKTLNDSISQKRDKTDLVYETVSPSRPWSYSAPGRESIISELYAADAYPRFNDPVWEILVPPLLEGRLVVFPATGDGSETSIVFDCHDNEKAESFELSAAVDGHPVTNRTSIALVDDVESASLTNKGARAYSDANFLRKGEDIDIGAATVRCGFMDAVEIGNDAVSMIRGNSISVYSLGSVHPVVYSVNGDYGDVTIDIPTISATDPKFSNAVLAVTTNTIRREVSASLNTYIDGETGVEYVGKFYGGSLYYVPTGNVYPPNN